MPMKQSRKQKPVPKQRTIDQLEFQINPESIFFGKKQSSQFYLYIEKGAQVLGKVDQLINAQSINYNFTKTHNKTFRAVNDKNLTYQWSIYKHTSDNEEQYLQSVSFNIKTHYVEYLTDLQKRQQDLYRIFQEKQKKTEIEDIWKNLKCDLTHNVIEMPSKFLKLNATVVFKIIIKCDLDFKLQKWEEERQKRRLARTVNGTRKGSVDSKNKASEMSFYQSKQKINEVNSIHNDSFSLPIPLTTQQSPLVLVQNSPVINPCFTSQSQLQSSIFDSQIRITDPQGFTVTDEVPQKFLNHEQILNQEFYDRKKSSMLSDIIEESYEGSSNVFSKSIQGERLQSLDEIHQEEETTPLFSPLIKTQNYDFQKNQEYSEKMRRTTTLVQKTSQQYDFVDNPKSMPKRPGYSFSNAGTKILLKSVENQNNKPNVSDMGQSCTRKSTFSEEQDNEMIVDFNEERRKTIKNVVKVIIILVVLILVINSINIFDHNEKKITNKEKRKFNNVNTKTESTNKKEQIKKSKFYKS